MSGRSFVCLHGHFYQPPRENPWLEAVEGQESAYPFHDWNERITAECYGPNAFARILDGEDRIVRIVNNYERISFNFGPTLLSWMEDKAPDIYAAVLEADRRGRERFSGHGPALAQAYGHLILPLADPRDKRTQVRWGARDFERRFGRRPEGMWLPETAVDVATLEELAEEGLRFTVLDPGQAGRVRRPGGLWHAAGRSRIDPKRPYLVRLPSGREIAVFFYDGPISRAIAFEDLLKSGDRFYERLKGAFDPEIPGDQLVHAATDGETYGHHHNFGDMALAYALDRIEGDPALRLTNYGEYLAGHPPQEEVEIVERSSWSCAHGVERWRSDCGCSTNAQEGWNQKWRAPLREALDFLRDCVRGPFEDKAKDLLRDPWAARDDYVSVILDRSEKSVGGFFERHRAKTLSAAETTAALKLMELQRYAQLMYASCGWFFADISGIETIQILRCAGRVLQLSRELFGNDFSGPFLERLQAARSNVGERGDGRKIFEECVRPVGMIELGAHFGVSALFTARPEENRLYAFDVQQDDFRVVNRETFRLALGRLRVRSRVTGDSSEVSYAFLHLGEHQVAGGARLFQGRESYQTMVREMTGALAKDDMGRLNDLLERSFEHKTYSLHGLFADERRRIVEAILEKSVGEAEALHEKIYKKRAPFMRFLTEMGLPQPKAFLSSAEFALNLRLRRVLDESPPDLARARSLLEEIRAGELPLDEPGVGHALEGAMERFAVRLAGDPADAAALEGLLAAAELAAGVPFPVDLWKVQNAVYTLLESKTFPRSERFEKLCARLKVRAPRRNLPS